MQPIDDSVVRYERRESVAVLTLNRPDRLNAWNQPLARALAESLSEAADDDTVRTVVITALAGRFVQARTFARARIPPSTGPTTTA